MAEYKVLYQHLAGTGYFALTDAVLFPPGESTTGTLANSMKAALKSDATGWAEISNALRTANPDLLGAMLTISSGAITAVDTVNRRLIPLSSPNRTYTRSTIAGLAKAHAERALNELNWYWVSGDSSVSASTITLDNNNTIQVTPNTSVTDRWRNTYYWILSGYAVVKHVAGGSFTDAQASDAYTAYEKLVPLGKIETWYRAHNTAVWAAYFPRSGSLTAYFKWATDATTFQDFAADAVTSSPWDGSATSRPLIQFAQRAGVGDI